MSDDKSARCSALIDGELPESEAATLLADLGRDKSARETVVRFYLIGDTVRNAVPEHWRPNFVSNVMKAVEEEPFWLLSSPESRAKKRWLVGGAIAASVCVVALFMSKAEQRQVVGKPTLIVGQAMQISEETQRIPSTQRRPTPQHTPQTRPASTSFAGESRLNYLVKHNQYLDSFTVHGVTPYARVVGYQAGR